MGHAFFSVHLDDAHVFSLITALAQAAVPWEWLRAEHGCPCTTDLAAGLDHGTQPDVYG
jgi:hypothetical protein